MTCDSLTVFLAIFYPLLIVGLAVDRCFILPERLGRKLVNSCKAQGRCVLCERPMRVLE